ncbi:MAG TPA: efflux RND transporter periplasmic adaptor subunit [Magnetospirillaceae bacterium]|nr:efflux RND transporter periplasmic adaptor subunit [Magnetospirillaceae bacterium]
MSSEPVTPPNKRRLRQIGLGALVLAGLVAGAGIAARLHASQSRSSWTDAQAVPSVSLVKPTPDAGGAALTLPGTIQPINKAAIYARVPGYLKEWREDIGASVTPGQVLAVIDTPDLDQQVAQARADLATAQAADQLAALTAKRWQAMAGSEAVAQQAIDEKLGDAQVKKAATAAMQANLGRLQSLEAFKSITAPFAGIVTARNTDIGALINPGSSAGQELFEVSDLRRVRIYVSVPQAFSAGLHPGVKAAFELPQYPGQSFSGEIATNSHALDAGSRSMLVELQADNPDGKLAAGAYCQVHLPLEAHAGGVQIPATALMASDHGAQVALIGADGKVEVRTVQLGRDLGDKLEVLAGLSADDQVIDNPPETLQGGDTVQVAGGGK